jgi:methylthioribose-1-phosphate isomerase
MMDFMAIYGEAGMIGIVGAMFVYLVVSLSNKSAKQQETLEDLKVENRGQSETLENAEKMIIALIDRWNKSDERMDRRHEAMLKEVDDLSDKVSYMSGRLNGHGKHG